MAEPNNDDRYEADRFLGRYGEGESRQWQRADLIALIAELRERYQGAASQIAERQARQELWSFVRLRAGKSDLQAVSVEWLDAWAPELVNGRFADVRDAGRPEPVIDPMTGKPW